MKLLTLIGFVLLIWIAFDLLWSLATMALFVLMIVGYKLIWGR